MATQAVVAEDVRKRYRTSEVLAGASLTVGAGETLALLGRNGAGKTTLVKILAGALSRDAGRVALLGQELGVDAAAAADLCGWVGQDSERSAYARLTVGENLRYFGALRGLRRRELAARIGLLAEALGFAARLDALFGTLSGGQKQAVIIARALLPAPRVALLDEPTKGLDPVAAGRVRSFLRAEVRTGMALLLTSHVLADVEALADRVAVVREGRVREEPLAPLLAALAAADPAEVERALGLGHGADAREAA